MRNAAERLANDWMGRMSQRMRRRRFAHFAALAERLPRPLTILDVGGRAEFWAAQGWADRTDVRIITGNIEPQRRAYTNIEPLVLDATDMSQFADKSVDLVFSNSVIEHLFCGRTKSRWRVRCAGSARRTGFRRRTSGFPWSRIFA